MGPPEVNAELEELFCQEFVKDFKGGAAARRVGIGDGSARSWASRMLDRPDVRERVSKVLTERRERVQIEADDVLRILVQIASTDINELVEFRRTCCRHCYGAGHLHQYTDGEFKAARARHGKEVKKADAEAQRTGMAAVEVEPFDEAGGAGFIATRDPNPDCPECHGEGYGSTFIKDTRELGVASAAYAGVKVTKDGIEVKLQDRMKAIELLGKHLGMFADSLNVKGELTVTNLATRMRRRAPTAGVDDLV